MTIYQYINTNRDFAKRLFELGILKYKADRYYIIYSRYLYYRKLGNTKTQSVKFASQDYCTCEKTGWCAVELMEQTI